MVAVKQHETRELFQQGRDAWNNWADRMLAERAELEASNDELREWHDRAKVQFREGDLVHGSDLSGFVFPGQADFQGLRLISPISMEGTEFHGTAKFAGTIFRSNVTFARTTFHDEAHFKRAKFSGYTDLRNCTFAGRATFDEMEVDGPANFTRCQFDQGADFRNTKFDDVIFNSAVSSHPMDFGGCEFRQDADFLSVRFAGAEFPSTRFRGNARFTSSEFMEAALFTRSKFFGDADFDNANFSDLVEFDVSTFQSVASFINSVFQSDLIFVSTVFKSDASFHHAQFYGSANFSRCRFLGSTSFFSCRINSYISFEAIRAESSFDLANARCRKVPNFIQAHFPEASRLDDIEVPTVTDIAKGTREQRLHLTARYRALKRLAIQGHDHDRELQFFADEMRSQLDERWKLKSVLIALYGHFSDFGRSILRPAAWWSVLFLLFGGIYYLGHRGWLLDGWHSACVSGDGSPLLNAIYLSLRKGLIFPGLSQTGKIDQVNACLFGFQTFATEDGVRRVVPDIPLEVAFLGMAQTLLSGILIFLVLLVFRNRFRIK